MHGLLFKVIIEEFFLKEKHLFTAEAIISPSVALFTKGRRVEFHDRSYWVRGTQETLCWSEVLAVQLLLTHSGSFSCPRIILVVVLGPYQTSGLIPGYLFGTV